MIVWPGRTAELANVTAALRFAVQMSRRACKWLRVFVSALKRQSAIWMALLV